MSGFNGSASSVSAARWQGSRRAVDELPPLAGRPAGPVGAPAPVEARTVSADPDERLVSLLDPRSFEAEQYRSLRLVLEERRRTAGLQVVAISSASIGEGKTTTTINLAGALAQTRGARVLVIDGDLRCPAVASQLGLQGPDRPGLAGAIADDDIPLGSALHLLPAWNLSVLTAGTRPGSPYELLMSPRFARVVSIFRGGFDFILIDCPPLLALPDCRLIDRATDGFLLVVSANQTPRKLLAEALNVVPQEKVIGLIFNRDTRPLHGYYGQYGRYYAGRRGPNKV